MASSGSVRLSEQLYHGLHNSRTVCKSCLVSAQSGPTVSGSRANSRHDVRRSSIDQAEGLGHQRRNPACCEGRAGVRARVRTDARDGRGKSRFGTIRYTKLWIVCAPGAADIATSSVARAVWCGSGVMVDGKTE